ncbi:hypothetical protein Tco_1151527, partial [Tanacetum coccineum]
GIVGVKIGALEVEIEFMVVVRVTGSDDGELRCGSDSGMLRWLAGDKVGMCLWV